ncbi:MAG: hypothetical protein ACI4SB_02280 [Acutalibacteraceae bacterium]
MRRSRTVAVAAGNGKTKADRLWRPPSHGRLKLPRSHPTDGYL